MHWFIILINNQKMNDRTNEKKLVEAFRTFFEKSINPYVNTNESVMNEWKYFSRLISAQPIDYSQIQFYLLLANKSHFTPPVSQPQFRATSYGENLKYNAMPSQTPNQIHKAQIDSDKKGSNSKTINSPKKKNLVACLQSFQNMLVKNQERLQSFNRKDINSNNTISANSSKRYY